MFSKNGNTIIKVVFSIIVIVAIIIFSINLFKFLLKTVDKTDIETEMLKIQAKAKIIMDKNKAEGTELQGIQISSEEGMKYNISEELKSEFPENTEKCYIWGNEIFEKQGLNEIKVDNNEFYIIEYETGEVFYSQGIKENGEKIYKLSELYEEKK